MLDPALIKECADPSLKPAIVEQFVEAAGSGDPLAVNVTVGGRLILVPKAGSADEAMEIVRQNLGHSIVRVGLTQFPAGVGAKDVSEVTSDLVDACENLREGTNLFAKVLRIVSKWYGSPKSDEVFPQIFEDAVFAWKTGQFEGQGVFEVDDPGGSVANPEAPADQDNAFAGQAKTALPGTPEQQDESEVSRAGMRVDLTRIFRE